jgi:hypothetical protein
MAEVKLLNKSKKPYHITLYPSIAGRRSSGKHYEIRKVRSASGKLMGEKQPHSYSIMPGKATSLPAVALHMPQVKAAMKSGDLKRLELAEAKPAKRKAEAKESSAHQESAKPSKSRKQARK